MKAIIMAGGEGTRLRPLTCDMPKPMMRLMDRPIIEYSLELLARHGVTETGITLGYLPERIRDHLGDDHIGIQLKYYTEPHPLGTAGSVRQASDMLTETFCVLSGDGVTDCDLTKALEFHKNSGALATMVLKRMPDPTEYGLVITAPDGRIERFLEKPSWGEVVSDTVNTGIYIMEPEILDMIPEGEYDFGSQLFPVLASMGRLCYWCDIGDVPAYLRMCRDALDGLIALDSLQQPSINGHYDDSTPVEHGCLVSPAAHVSADAKLEAPCYVGPGAHIARGAVISAHSIIGAGARVDELATIKRSVVWENCRIAEGAGLRGCALGRSVSISPCARVYENSALGTGVRVGADAEVAPGVYIWPDKTVAAAMLLDHNLVWGPRENTCFRNGMLPIDSPANAVRAAQACAAALQPGELLLGRTASATAAALWHSCAAGLMAQGVQVLDAGVCTEPQLRFAMSLMGIKTALLATPDGVIPLSGGGVRLSGRQQRSICALISRQDHTRPFMCDPRPVIYSGRSDQAYIAMLASAFTADPSLAPHIAVHSRNQHLLTIAEQAFSRAGLNARCEWEEELMELYPGEIGVWLASDGLSTRFSHPGGMLTAPQNELLAAWTLLERGETTLITDERATRAIQEIADRRNAEICPCAAAGSGFEHALTAYPDQLRTHTDGIYLAVCAISTLTENALTLAGWLSTMPKVHRIERSIPLSDSDRGRALRRFGNSGDLRIDRGNAYAYLSPDASRPECRIVAESRDMEAARELCDFCESRLKEALTEE